MNFLEAWMQSGWVKALGWTFVHSLWQITIIGFLLFVILRMIPGRSAHVRYTISTLAIWTIVITALSTFLIMLPGKAPARELAGQLILIKTDTALSFTDKVTIWLESYMPMMLTVWIGGVLILLIRLLISLGWITHMKSTAEVSDALQQSLDLILQRLRIRMNIQVSESRYISSPFTFGHLKPVILFPVGLINQLTPSEVEAVLTHELAHIVRRDYLSNLIQSFIETLFYYHPVTWWISRVVRTERENRADDLAIKWCGDHLGYAKALLSVQEMQLAQQPLLAIGFSSSKGALLHRIQRILHIPNKNHNQMEKTVLLSLCSLCFLAFTLTGNGREQEQDKMQPSAVEKKFIAQLTPVSDTIPSEGTYRIHKKTDEQEISIEVEDGNIIELEIDGKKIEPADHGAYDDVIHGLFGEIEAPRPMHGYRYAIPSVPGVPGMPGMIAIPPMSPMPPMPPMEAIELERIYEGGAPFIAGGDGFFKHRIVIDSLNPSRIVIFGNDGDTTYFLSPGGRVDFFEGDAPAFHFNQEEWQKHNEEWQRWAEEWKQNAKRQEGHAEEWKKATEEWRKEWKENSKEWEKEHKHHQDAMKELERLYHNDGTRMRIGGVYGQGGAELKELEEIMGAEGIGRSHVYALRAPGLNMADAMIQDGLIDRGEEADILLTPDKLKINGKRMDDETHQKYLRMYEAQQGIELSGNSRVEFKTKSRRSM